MGLIIPLGHISRMTRKKTKKINKNEICMCLTEAKQKHKNLELVEPLLQTQHLVYTSNQSGFTPPLPSPNIQISSLGIKKYCLALVILSLKAIIVTYFTYLVYTSNQSGFTPPLQPPNIKISSLGIKKYCLALVISLF